MLLSRRPRPVLALMPVAALLFAMSGLLLPNAANADTDPAVDVPATVSSDILPTVQINGVVWSQAVVGNTVWAGGQFTAARPAGAPPGTDEVTRNNLLAYDIRTGELITSIVPDLNAQVLSVTASPDGSRVYVGGDFTVANGQKHYRIAAYDAATGQLINSFNPGVDYKIRAMVATPTTLYLAGSFSGLSGAVRTNLGAVDATTGKLLPWAPTSDGAVSAITISPDGSRVIVGGVFTQLSGVAAYGLGAIDAASGEVLPWTTNTIVRDAGANAGITSLSTDGTYVYGTGYVFGSGGNFEGTFAADPNSGALVWMEDCHGDTYSAYGMGDVVYSIGHVHFCGNVGGYPETNPRTHHHALAWTKAVKGTITRNTTGNYANWEGRPRPDLLHWFPDPEAGTYTGQGQAGWNITGNSDYVVIGGEFPRVDGTPQQGLVRFATRAIAPNQSGPVNRGGAALNPDVQSFQPGTVRIDFPATWDRDNAVLTYKLIRDNDTANPIWSQTLPSNFWTLPTMRVTDSVTPGTTHRYKLVVVDPLGNESRSENVTVTAASLATTSAAARQLLSDGPSQYWRLGEGGTTAYDWAGFDDLTLGTGVSGGQAGAYDGDPNPASRFDGTSQGRGATAAAAAMPASFSLEAWVKTTTTRGGKIIGAGSAAAGSSSFTDRNLWVRNDGKVSFGVKQNGSNRILTSSRVVNDGQWHHVAATLGGTGQVLYVDGVVAGATASVTSASAQTAFWRVGGDTLSGWSGAPSSGYLAGTIDDVAVFARQLSAATIASHYAPPTVNDPPTAAFTSSASWLDASFDGTGSSDSDGSIASYAWDFGDGGTGTGASVLHSYAAAGTYDVTLTVTDNGGASSAVTHSVTVAAPSSSSIADDTFTRTVTGGFGSADLGGPWSVAGGASNFSVDGSSGRLRMNAGATLTAALAAISEPSADTTVDLSVDKPQTGGGTYASVLGRRVTSNTDYRAKLRFLADGRVTVGLSRMVAGAETSIATAVTVASGVGAGDVFHVRIQTVGASPTTVQAKVWKAGDVEPSTWTLTATDATAQLQAPGGVALQSYLSGSATNAPVTLTVDELHVRRPDAP